MPTKKTKKLHYHHSRHANTREILMALIFGALVLLFLTLTIINVTSNKGTAYTYSTEAAAKGSSFR